MTQDDDLLVVYHGTNRVFDELLPGSWVTADFDVALAFAEDKSRDEGGDPVIYMLEVREGDIEWDVMSTAAGVGDDRGQTVASFGVAPVPLPGSPLL